MIVRDVEIKSIGIVENVRVQTDKHLSTLMESIKQHGLKEPIGVQKATNGEYVLVYGFRRLSAYKKLGYTNIPAVIEEDKGVGNLLITNMLENIQRRDVTPYELGRICARLLNMKLTVGEIAVRLGVNSIKIKAALTLFKKLPKHLRDKVIFMGPGKPLKEGAIPATVAFQAYKIKKTWGLSENDSTLLIEAACAEELTTRDLEVIGYLLKQGLSIKKALKEKSKYKTIRADMVVLSSELKEKVNKYKLSPAMLLRKTIVGEVTPFTAIEAGARGAK